MKNIVILITIATCLFMLACSQQEDISGKVETEMNDRADVMIDSLKRACDTNFDNALQTKVTAAIKANNQPAVQAKPSIKASSKPVKKTPKATTPPPPPPKPAVTGGRKGIGKGGGILKNQTQGGVKTAPVVTRPAQTTKPQNPGTTTTQPTGVKGRPGTKVKKGGE